MSLFSIYLRIIFCLCLLPFAFVGAFQFCFIDYDETGIAFYASIASAFIFVVFYLLNTYFTVILQKKYSAQLINDFTKDAVRVDNNVISPEDVSKKCDAFMVYVDFYEKCVNELFAKVIPYGECFILLIVTLFIVEYRVLFFMAFIIPIMHVIVWFFCNIVFQNTTQNYAVFISNFCNSILSAVRGIQFFGAADTMTKSVQSNIKLLNKEFKQFSACYLWKQFILLCIIFCIACTSYIIADCYDSITPIVNKYVIPLISCVFMYCLLAKSSFHFLNFRKQLINKDFLFDYTFQYDTNKTNKIDSKRDIFIAFHRVCFHDPSLTSDKPIFDNLTFSVMPYESVAVTGENIKSAFYLFDLMFKFYKCQSGNIYIAGININNIDTNSLRNMFSVFKTDFGIIDSTVMENLQISAPYTSDKKILNIADNVGLSDALDKHISTMDQEMMIRIQMARTLLRKSKVVVMESPSNFAKYSSKELFMEFVHFISKRSTVFLVTNDTMMTVYCNKILYIGNTVTAFGTHAELSYNNEYRKFLS